MRRGLAGAVINLRARKQWGQMELADRIRKQGERAKVALDPDQETISRWECGQQAPSPTYREALAKIAAKHGYEDLAELFRASMSSWRLVGYVSLGLMKMKG